MWLFVLVFGFTATLLFELYEHYGEPNPIDQHFVREVIFFGIIFPFAFALLLRKLIDVKEKQDQSQRQQALGRQLNQELLAAENWDELIHIILQFPLRIVPVLGDRLYRYETREDGLVPIADSWLTDSQRTYDIAPVILDCFCGIEHRGAYAGMHSFQLTSPYSEHVTGHCLPLFRNNRLVGSLQIFVPRTYELEPQEISLMNHIAPAIALALDSVNQENPEFIRSAAIRHERERMTRHLHDTLVQSLSFLRLKLDMLVMNDPLVENPAVRRDLERMRDVADEAYEQIRSSLMTLKPDSRRGLADELVEQVRVAAEEAEVIFEYRSYGTPWPITPLTQRKIVFIFREAMSNIFRHAEATNVLLSMIWTDEELTIRLADDGQGFELQSRQEYGHFGLLIMEKRAQEIGGELQILSTPGQGTQVVLRYHRLREHATDRPAARDSQ